MYLMMFFIKSTFLQKNFIKFFEQVESALKKGYNLFMAKIRKLLPFDTKKIKNMISFLGNDEAEKFMRRVLDTSCDLFHYWLPLEMKFKTESYVLVENGELLGMISVKPTYGNPYKLNITRLMFKKDYLAAGKQLVEFILARYGAKGVQTFIVSIDDSHDELLNLFNNGCGFRNCSCEQLWRVNLQDIQDNISQPNFRLFKNTDAQAAAMLYNDTVITHFKPSMLKTKNEYFDTPFKGLKDGLKWNYVQEDRNLHTLAAYFSIQSLDFTNYIIDITSSIGISLDYDSILNFAQNEIKKRVKNYTIFVKTKQYTEDTKMLEEYLNNKQFSCVQTQNILVKDFYKLIKQPSESNEIVLFAETTKPVFKIKY